MYMDSINEELPGRRLPVLLANFRMFSLSALVGR